MIRKGQVFRLNGVKWKVTSVNASRAHCVATITSTYAVTDKKTGQKKPITRRKLE